MRLIPGFNCLDPHLHRIAAEMAVYWTERGVDTFEGLKTKLLLEFGDLVRPHLNELHEGAGALIDIALAEFDLGTQVEHGLELGVFGPLLDRIRSEQGIVGPQAKTATGAPPHCPVHQIYGQF